MADDHRRPAPRRVRAPARAPLSAPDDVGTFPLASANAVPGVIGSARIAEDVARRPAYVYRPGRAEKDSFVPRLIRAARDGRGGGDYGDNSQIRDVAPGAPFAARIFDTGKAQFSGPLILIDRRPAVMAAILCARSIGFQPGPDPTSSSSSLATAWPEFAEAA
jgi:hypothetical protein